MVDFGCASDADCCGASGDANLAAGNVCLSDGACQCAPGFGGRSCEYVLRGGSMAVTAAATRQAHCGGYWELGSSQCQCRANTTGVECSKAAAPLASTSMSCNIAPPSPPPPQPPAPGNDTFVVVLAAIGGTFFAALVAAALVAYARDRSKNRRGGAGGGRDAMYVALSPRGRSGV